MPGAWTVPSGSYEREFCSESPRMSHRILFVDDEHALLDSVARSLGLKFNITTALSGAEALQTMKENGPYSVVVTDMRMPGMNGIEFIKKARETACESIFIMLTGNQDLGTATQAINEGEVFRFINKPCNNATLEQSLKAAIKYFEAILAEKELLNRTFVGAVSAITAVLEKAHPELAGIGSSTSRLLSEICRGAGIDERWEFKLAARLYPLGFAMMESVPHLDQLEGVDVVACHKELMQSAASLASDLFEKIPRLETVAAIIRSFIDADGGVCHLSPRTAAAITSVGRTLVRVALQSHFAWNQGTSSSEILREVKESLPTVDQCLLDGINLLSPKMDLRGVALSVDRLRAGMVVNGEVTSNGAILLSQGKRLNEGLIEKLRQTFDSQCETAQIEISAASLVAWPPLLEPCS